MEVARSSAGEAVKRVLVDLRMASHTGIGRYVRCLMGALAPETAAAGLSLCGAADPGQDLSWLPPGVAVTRWPRRVPAYSLREQALLPRWIDSLPWDLLHVPHFVVPRLASRRPLVATIHDLAYMDWPGGGRTSFHAWAARRMLRACARRAARILTVSSHARGRIVSRLGVPPHRVRVILHGIDHLPDPTFLPPAAREPATLLYVGNHLPHKNLPLLMEVFACLRRERSDARLLLAGPVGRHTPVAMAAARRCGVDGAVDWLGAVSDETLVGLYRRATLLVFPSRYEGFGFPPLEAMRLGLPVVASAATAIPEIAGGAAVLLPPDDPAAWIAAVRDLLADAARREDLARRGTAWAARFTWTRAARETAAVYKEVLETGGA